MVVLKATESEPSLSVFVARGELTAQELLAVSAGFLAEAPSRLALVDMTAATLAGIGTPDIRRLAAQLAKLKEWRGAPHKAVLVCGRPVDFGLARLLLTHLSLEGCPVRFAVFMHESRARAWLHGDEDNE